LISPILFASTPIFLNEPVYFAALTSIARASVGLMPGLRAKIAVDS
jgi:hypothetical protein